MEADRSVARVGRSLVAGAVLGLAAGCGLIQPTEPPSTSDAGDTAANRPYRRPATPRVVEPDAGRVSTKPQLTVQFDAYLDDDSFETYNAGTLRAGGRSWGGWTAWRVVRRQLVWRARGTLPDDVEPNFSLADGLETVTGTDVRPLPASDRDYTVDADVPRRQPEDSSTPAWSDIAPIVERRCNECHADPDWDLVDLTPDDLVGADSRQVDRLLVKPYDPADSYLLQKILWDYPNLRYEPQPPPWSGGRELPERLQVRIERWIDAGAPH